MKQFALLAAVIVAIIGGAVIFGKSEDVERVPSNNFFGNEQASVTLVEYGDFSCPTCAFYHQSILKDLKTVYAEDLKLEFRHFALLQNLAPHRAAEAAAKQGKFWEMHDLLFERQASWQPERSSGGAHGGTIVEDNQVQIFEGYAQEIGLDMDQYRSDYADSSTLGTINADTELARADGGDGTPTFILNGVKIDDLSSVDTFEEFSAVIQQAIDEANSTSSEEQSGQSETETPEVPAARPEDS